jgi:hypothetical protein
VIVAREMRAELTALRASHALLLSYGEALALTSAAEADIIGTVDIERRKRDEVFAKLQRHALSLALAAGATPVGR